MNQFWSMDVLFRLYLNDFILNLFLRHPSHTYQENLPQHAEEPNVAKQLV